MKAGLLNKPASIERLTTEQDEFGQAVPEPAVVVPLIWVAIDPLSADERISGGKLVEGVTHRLRFRFDPALDLNAGSFRMTHDGRVFEFRSVLNRNERDKEYVVLAEEVVG